MNMTDAVLIYTTWPDRPAAERFGQNAVKERLIACINILPEMTSIYEWEGRCEKTSEVVALLKTSAVCIEALKKKLQTEHPYDCPCFLVFSVKDGLPEFLSWIDRQTQT